MEEDLRDGLFNLLLELLVFGVCSYLLHVLFELFKAHRVIPQIQLQLLWKEEKM